MTMILDAMITLVAVAIAFSALYTGWMYRLGCIGEFRQKWMLAEAVYSWRTVGECDLTAFETRREKMNSWTLAFKPLFYATILGGSTKKELLLHDADAIKKELVGIKHECPELYSIIADLHGETFPDFFR